MGIRVIDGGLLTTIQDFGRISGLANGFSPSGVMDTDAASLANILVDNDYQTPLVEYSVLGPTITFTTATVIAIAGATVNAKINGQQVDMNGAINVEKGDTLAIGPTISGRYGYLAIAGGVIVPEVMQSYATSLKYGLGGFKGRALRTGDYLSIPVPAPAVANVKQRQVDFSSVVDDSIVTIKVTKGPEYDQFDKDASTQFFNQTYEVSNDSDRMGMRLSGEPINVAGVPEMLSEATVLGGIQIPKSGEPIILLPDRQTTGGYPVIAVVSSVDLSKAVQLMPGQKLQFKLIDLAFSQQLLHEKNAEMAALKLKFSSMNDQPARRMAQRLSRIFKE